MQELRLRIRVGDEYIGTIYADRTGEEFGRLLVFSGGTCIAVLPANGTKAGVEIREEREEEKKQ